jgi:hypothetical protein
MFLPIRRRPPNAARRSAAPARAGALLLALAGAALGQGVDVNVSAIPGHEAEVSISVNPLDPLNQVICGHAPSPFETMNTFWTRDGGATWTLVSLGPAEDGLPTNFRFDPTVAFAGDGNVYVAYGAGTSSDRALVCARSRDGGETYDRFTFVRTNDSSLDKWILNTGPDSDVPDQWNVYLAYRVSEGFDAVVRLAASYDQGVTFPVDRKISDDGGLNTFGMPAVGPEGEVYVVFDDQSEYPDFSRIEVDVSFDDGATFGNDVLVSTTPVTRGNSVRYDILAQPDRGILACPSIAVDRSDGPFRGRVYVTYVTVGAGGFDDTNVVLRYSDDRASTWSGEVLVHLPNPNSQFHPWVDVDPATGMVAVAWYDARADLFDNEKVEAWAALSLDGGATWNETRLSDGQSDQSESNPERWSNNYLEYIGVCAREGVAYAVWADNSQDPADLDYFTDHFALGIAACQGQDRPDSDVLFVNGQIGPFVALPAAGPHEFSIVRPPAGGKGKFVVHLDAGAPGPTTYTQLPASLGTFCFPLFVPPFGAASPSSVWNSLGKEARVGASNYFALPVADPDRAPTVFHSSPSGDVANLPIGSEWTLQGIILNPDASGTKPGSVTNAIQLVVE